MPKLGFRFTLSYRTQNFPMTLPMPYRVTLQSLVKISQELWEHISQNPSVQVPVEVQGRFELQGSKLARTLLVSY